MDPKEEGAATTETRDAVIADVVEKINTIDERVADAVSTETLSRLIEETITGLLGDGEFARKMRFAIGSDTQTPHLLGSKFARWNLSISDIEFLYDTVEAANRYNPQKYTGPSDELRNAYEHISQSVYLPQEEVRAIDRRAIDDLFPRVPKHWLSNDDQRLREAGRIDEMEAYQRSLRAMDSAESGYGQQLIGAQYVQQLWEAARRESRVFALLSSFEMTDPTSYLPIEADIPEMLFVPESTANNSPNYDTSKTGSNRVQVDARKFVIHQMWSGELEEDSIIPFIPYLRRQAVLSLAHYSDSVVINGDTVTAATGNINSDDGAPAATKHYLAFDGVRKVGLVDNTNNAADLANAGITWVALTNAFSRMVDMTYLMDWGHPTDSMDLVQVVDPFTADKIGQLSEVVTWRQQQGRTLRLGQVAEVLGHPVIGSMAMGLTEADGKISTTPANNTRGQVATMNTRGFVPGWRRRVRTEVERLPASDQTRIVYSLRMGFGRYAPSGAATSIEAADVIYNINVT